MMTTSTTDRFSVHYSEQLWYNWVDFLFTIRLCNFDTGWTFCVISLWSFSQFLSPQKGTPTMVTQSTYQIPSSGLSCR